MGVFMAQMLHAYGDLVDKRPIATQVVTAGMLSTLGDIITQLVLDRKKKYDWYRTVVMATCGYVFSGPIISLWLMALNSWSLPLVANVFLDQFVLSPLLLGGFLIIHSLFHRKGWKTATHRVKYELLDVVKANWILWIPAQVINFKLVPFKYRMLFIQSLALFWNCYLSKKANSSPSQGLIDGPLVTAEGKTTVF